MLSEEQIKNIKKQLFEHIEKLPENQRESAKNQIENMNAEELEQFLIQNKMIQQGGLEQEAGEIPENECIFCLIIEGKVPSYRIDENKDAIAILEINPLSKGHSIIVPKKHEPIESQPPSILSLAKKTAKRIKSKLKSDDIKIETTKAFGHGIINIIPIYKDKKLAKVKAEEKELIELHTLLKAKKREKKAKKEKEKPISSLPKVKRRIP